MDPDNNRIASLNTVTSLMEHRTRTQQLLTSLQDSIVDKPPYISGTLKLPESFFSLFYKLSKDDDAARSEPLTLNAKGPLLNTFFSSQAHQPCQCYSGEIGATRSGL